MNYIFFWKPKDEYGFMSQWYQADMYIGGLKYVNCEQYMMASKALLFDDKETYEEIMTETNPHKIKELGRKVKNFDEKIWDVHKERIIFEGNFAKFDQNYDLQEKLLETEDAVLAEASPYDKIYGIGMKTDNPNVEDTHKWGQNLLGCAIMSVREIFINECR